MKADQCLPLTLKREHWAEAITAALLQLAWEKQTGYDSHRNNTSWRDPEEKFRVRADGLACEAALQEQYISFCGWNAFEGKRWLPDIGDAYEVRSYNCMTAERIREHWARMGRVFMEKIEHRGVSFDFIRTKGHVEIYPHDKPNRHCTFVAIVSPTQAWVVGGISIAVAHSYREDLSLNTRFEGREEKDKIYWTPVHRLHPPSDCPWYDPPYTLVAGVQGELYEGLRA